MLLHVYCACMATKPEKVEVYMAPELKQNIRDRADDRDQSMSAYLKELARRDIQQAIEAEELEQ
jgi:hypothetical protein